MAGELVPLVLLPRYSSFNGGSTFTTIAMEVTNYSKAIINVWRGKLLGTSPTIGFTFEESTDQLNWTTCANTSANADPGEESEAQYEPTLNKRWFRIRVALGGTSPAASCWAIGFLEMRES